MEVTKASLGAMVEKWYYDQYFEYLRREKAEIDFMSSGGVIISEEEIGLEDEKQEEPKDIFDLDPEVVPHTLNPAPIELKPHECRSLKFKFKSEGKYEVLSSIPHLCVVKNSILLLKNDGKPLLSPS